MPARGSYLTKYNEIIQTEVLLLLQRIIHLQVVQHHVQTTHERAIVVPPQHCACRVVLRRQGVQHTQSAASCRMTLAVIVSTVWGLLHAL